MNSTAIALNTEAINHVQKGEFAEAITCLKCAIKMEDSFVLRLNLGLTYRDSGNFRKAKTALEKAQQALIKSGIDKETVMTGGKALEKSIDEMDMSELKKFAESKGINTKELKTVGALKKGIKAVM